MVGAAAARRRLVEWEDNMMEVVKVNRGEGGGRGGKRNKRREMAQTKKSLTPDSSKLFGRDPVRLPFIRVISLMHLADSVVSARRVFPSQSWHLKSWLFKLRCLPQTQKINCLHPARGVILPLCAQGRCSPQPLFHCTPQIDYRLTLAAHDAGVPRPLEAAAGPCSSLRQYTTRVKKVRNWELSTQRKGKRFVLLFKCFFSVQVSSITLPRTKPRIAFLHFTILMALSLHAAVSCWDKVNRLTQTKLRRRVRLPRWHLTIDTRPGARDPFCSDASLLVVIWGKVHRLGALGKTRIYKTKRGLAATDRLDSKRGKHFHSCRQGGEAAPGATVPLFESMHITR